MKARNGRMGLRNGAKRRPDGDAVYGAGAETITRPNSIGLLNIVMQSEFEIIVYIG